MNPSVFTSLINSYLPEPHSSLLNGIIFGIDIKTSKLFYEQLKTDVQSQEKSDKFCVISFLNKKNLNKNICLFQFTFFDLCVSHG